MKVMNVKNMHDVFPTRISGNVWCAVYLKREAQPMGFTGTAINYPVNTRVTYGAFANGLL
jgi:hypothetical protein